MSTPFNSETAKIARSLQSGRGKARTNHRKVIKVGYLEISKLTNISEEALRKRSERGEFSLNDLQSVIDFVVSQQLAAKYNKMPRTD